MNSKHIGADNLPLRIPHEVAALIPALQLREPSTALLRDLSDQEWADLLAFCDLAHLTLALAQLPTAGFPHWVVERLNTNLTDNAQRFERVRAAYKEATNALSKAGVEHIVIKGFTQCPDYVELPGLRVQSDLDLYCPAEMIEPARIALETLGYIPSKGTANKRTDHTAAMVRRGDWTWSGNHYDPEMPLSIELHFCLWNEAASLFSVPGVESFWERRTIRSLEDLSFPCLSPVDHLGYLALHILRNILLRDWVIHHVRELAFFLHTHANDDAFWAAWSETQDASLRSLEAIAFYYARAWFNCDLHQQVQKEVANISPSQQQWLRRFVGSAFEVMFHQNKDSVWLHLSLLKIIQGQTNAAQALFYSEHHLIHQYSGNGSAKQTVQAIRQTTPIRTISRLSGVPLRVLQLCKFDRRSARTYLAILTLSRAGTTCLNVFAICRSFRKYRPLRFMGGRKMSRKCHSIVICCPTLIRSQCFWLIR